MSLGRPAPFLRSRAPPARSGAPSPDSPAEGRPTRWLARARRPALAVLTGLALFVAISTAYWQVRSTFAIPYWDQWTAVLDYFRFRSGEIGIPDLFSQSNEHRIFFPRLIMFADLGLFGGRNAFNVAMSDLFQVSHLALLLWMGRAVLARSSAGAAASICITAAMLTGSQYENIYWGFQCQFVMVFLFASAALAAGAGLPRATRLTPAAAGRVAAAVLAAVVATFSMANGLLVWPLLALIVLQRRASPIALGIVGAAGAVSAAFYLHGYVSVGAHTPLTAALYHPLDAVSYFLAYLGAVAAPQSPWAAAGLGAALLIVLAVLAGRRAARRAPFEGRHLFFWGVVLFVLLSAALTTLGRFGFGIIQALSPRYVTPDAILWSATTVLTLDEITTARSALARGLFSATVAALTAWLAIVNQPLAFGRMADHERKMMSASDAVVAGVTDPATLADLGPSAEAVVDVSKLLRAQGLSVFGSREAGWMGQPLDRVFTVTDDPSCLGNVDVVRPLGPDGSSGATVAGWAWIGAAGRGPAEVVFADESGTVLGFARGQLSRPDVPAANTAIPSDRVGFRGFLSPDRGSEVQAYAVRDDAGKACPVGQ